MSDWRPGADRDALVARAGLLARIRRFFADRGVLEVSTPLLAGYGVSDPGIEVFPVSGVATGAAPRFLQSSPEYAMKRLLSAGSGDIYQLGPAFRDGEVGARHNPEFTLLEWYRSGFQLPTLIGEVGDLVGACLQRPDWEIASYRQLFVEVLGLDPHRAATAELAACARRELGAGKLELELDRDGWLDLLMSHCVEPALTSRGMLFVHDYPASQAALARCVERDGVRVADRFELYVDGVELANGYRELLDAGELRQRAAADNRRRAAAGQAERAADPRLLAALEAGMPDCSGVALGVDRLLMVQLGARSLSEVLAFSWERS